MAEKEDWWYQDYDPKISIETWLKILHDGNIFNFNSMCMMKRMLDSGGKTSNTELSKKYGRSANSYTGIGNQLAKRIMQKTNCKNPPNQSVWPVLFLGRGVTKNDNDNGEFIWKLRPELEEALKQMDAKGELEKYPLYEENHDSAWLLTWNEKNWNWEKYDDWCVGTKNGETYSESWTCKSKQPKIGDHVFLIKLGDEPCGIIAHGFVSKESYDAPVFDSEKAEQGKTCPHIDVEFDAIRNYKNEDILKIETLQSELPSQTWCPQFSGSQIKEENVSKLLELWNELNGEKTMSTKNPLVENLANLLLNTHNLILHGAPGTGKTHLAHEIAKAMNAETSFVQFHPSYDYTDFVEGLRPVKSSDGTSSIGFERKDGVFKEFCKRALNELSNNIEKWLKENVPIRYPGKKNGNIFEVNLDGELLTIKGTNKDGKEFNNTPEHKKDLLEYCKFPIEFEEQHKNQSITLDTNNYILKEVIKAFPFLFIIDEINRGELSKIFGELFYAIEPGYRGEKGRIQTQYQNLVEESDVFKDGFYIPDNVYIIGTMNDIDRNVEAMDFAFRRRFTFYEVKAEDTIEMFAEIKDESIRETAISKMKNLNYAIWHKPEKNEKDENKSIMDSSSYHIGGAYFLKLNDFSGSTEEKFAQLWNYHLEGLLQEYLRGRDDAEEKLAELKKAYDSKDSRVKPENDINRKTENDTNSASHSEQSEKSADE